MPSRFAYLLLIIVILSLLIFGSLYIVRPFLPALKRYWTKGQLRLNGTNTSIDSIRGGSHSVVGVTFNL